MAQVWCATSLHGIASCGGSAALPDAHRWHRVGCSHPCFILQADEPLGSFPPPPPPHPIASIILGEKTQPSAPLGRAAPLRNVSCSEEDFSGSALVQQKCWRSLVHHSVPKHTRTAPTPARLLLGVRPIGTLWGGPGLSLHSKSHSVPAASFIFLGSPCPAPSNLISLEIPHPLLSARSFST